MVLWVCVCVWRMWGKWFRAYYRNACVQWEQLRISNKCLHCWSLLTYEWWEGYQFASLSHLAWMLLCVWIWEEQFRAYYSMEPVWRENNISEETLHVKQIMFALLYLNLWTMGRLTLCFFIPSAISGGMCVWVHGCDKNSWEHNRGVLLCGENSLLTHADLQGTRKKWNPTDIE